MQLAVNLAVWAITLIVCMLMGQFALGIFFGLFSITTTLITVSIILHSFVLATDTAGIDCDDDNGIGL